MSETATKEGHVTTESAPSILEAKSFAEVLQNYIGTKICVCCARYHWRGRLAVANSDSIVLSDATQIDVTGPCGGNEPTSEDKLHGDAVIKTDAIETMYQPNFSQAPLPGEDVNE